MRDLIFGVYVSVRFCIQFYTQVCCICSTKLKCCIHFYADIVKQLYHITLPYYRTSMVFINNHKGINLFDLFDAVIKEAKFIFLLKFSNKKPYKRRKKK